MRRALLTLLLLLSVGQACQADFADWSGYFIVDPPDDPATDFPNVISLDQAPSEWWDAVGTDGADIRASDENGQELAVHVKRFTDNGSTGTGVIVVQDPGTEDADTRIFVYAGNAEATLPAADSEFGSENAYPTSIRFWALDGLGVDGTQYGNDTTDTGSPTPGDVDGPINGMKGTSLDGSQYGAATDDIPSTLATGAMFVHVKLGNQTANHNLISLSENGNVSNNNVAGLSALGASAGDPFNYAVRDTSTSGITGTTDFGTGTWYNPVGINVSASSRVLYVDGTGEGTAASTRSMVSMDTIAVGTSLRSEPTFTMGAGSVVSNARLDTVSRSPEYVARYYAMFADPDQSDFYGVPVWVAIELPDEPSEVSLFPPVSTYPHWGDFTDEGTYYFLINTFGQDGVGATLTSEQIAVYKDASNSELTSGVSIDDNADSRVGMHRISIDTTQTGFDAGSMYFVVFTAGTSDTVVLTPSILGSFRLTNGYVSVDPAALRSAIGMADPDLDEQLAAKPNSNALNSKEEFADAIGERQIPDDPGAGSWDEAIGLPSSVELDDEQLAALAAQVGTPANRLNFDAAKAYQFDAVSMADGTYKAVGRASKEARYSPGAIPGDGLAFQIYMDRLFPGVKVKSVGAPTISSGSLEPTAIGIRETSAMGKMDGTATAGETPTCTVPVTMDTDETVNITFDIKVFGE